MKNIIVMAALFSAIAVRSQQKKAETPMGSTEVEEVIIQGNRVQTPFNETARDIQVITQKEIMALPAKSLNEVLSYISGIDIRQRGPFGTQADITIDGGTSEQTLLLINGVKMLDAQSAHNMMNIPVPLTAIDHIEVIRGAAARIYGINALTGAVNIVTKKSKRSSLSADLQAGTSFQSKDEGDGSGIYSGASAEVTAIYGTENQSQLLSLAQSGYSGQRYNSASENTRLFYAGNYHFNATNSINTMAGYARNQFGANGFYAAPGDRNAEEHTESSIFSLSSSHTFGRFTFSPRISDRYGEDDYRYYRNDLTKGRSLHYTNALMLELNSSLTTAIGTWGFGVESRLENIASSNIGTRQRANQGMYLELKTALSDRLRGSVGLYANYNSSFGYRIYPGIDAAYVLNPHWKLSASLGSAQRIPSFTDLYLNQRPGNIGNERLQPENAWNYEGSVQYAQNSFRFKTGYFFRNITGFIDWVRDSPSQPYSPYNLGQNKMHGIYGRLQQDFSLRPDHSLGYDLTYNFLQPTLGTATGKQSKYTLESLKHQFVAGVHYRIHDFSLHLKDRWLKRELGDAYHVADVRLNYTLQSFLLYTEVTNLFSAAYGEAGAVPMPPRWFSVGIKYDWNQRK